MAWARETSVLLGVLLLGCSSAASSVERESAASEEPTPPTRGADLNDAACERCHVEEARTFRESAHGVAFSDEVFQAEWAAQRQPECVHCHAPLSDASAPDSMAALGVSCTVCHLRNGSVLSTGPALDAPHPITVDAAFGTVEACAGCHDFDFASVAPTPYAESGMLQGTVREWHEVEERGSCQSCHMREGERVTHAMGGGRDPELLANALNVDASLSRRDGATEVVFILTSRAGHAVPTGDMYRRLEVSTWAPGGAPVSTVLMRRFASVDGVLRQVSDTRIPPTGPRRVVLTLPANPRQVRWRITWQALDPALATSRWIPEDVAQRVVAEGTLTE